MNWKKRLFLGILGIICVLSGILVANYYFSLSSKNTPTSAVETTSQISDNVLRQMEELGQPEIIPFEPDEEFIVVDSSNGRIAIAELSLTTIKVKRTSDNAIFQVATKIYWGDPTGWKGLTVVLSPGMESKLFKISWNCNILTVASARPDGFLLAVPLEVASSWHVRPLSKGPK